MRDVLRELIAKSACRFVFTSLADSGEPSSEGTFSSQQIRVKRKGGFHADAGLHTLRHSFLTEMGRLTDAFTLMRVAGHSKMQTTMRYVHPQKKAVDDAFAAFFGEPSGHRVVSITFDRDKMEKLLAGDTVSIRLSAPTSEIRIKHPQNLAQSDAA